MPRRPSDSLIFDTLRLEGGLFIPAVLEKAARGEHTAQKAADYRLPKGLSLVDEQGRGFRIASALHKTFQSARVREDVDAGRATEGSVIELLRDALGYADISLSKDAVTFADRAYPVTAFACGSKVPIIVAPHTLDLDTTDERFAILGSGRRKVSAYQLGQQFLNASPACTWAIVTNGRQLRLVRDADTLTRPAYLEADLDLILADQRYSDFAAVWRLFHASRAGSPEISEDDSVWQAWKREGEAQGERVRDGLRTGVTEALLALGTGFLTHPANEPLRQSLQSGALGKDAYFQQLLRLVYRCLFVFTVEERGLLHVPDDRAEARQARDVYAQGYAFRRLRERALRRAGFDRHHDLWASVRVVFRGLAHGEPRLALPALGGLFSPRQCPDLDAAKLENRALLEAMRCLRWSKIGGSLAAIDYRNMGPEELGSVYESLLELVPTVDLATRHFGFVGLTEAGSTEGNARKTSGSYYTPDSLVQELLDSALDPVIAQKLAGAPADPTGALLSISVIDPACGSGHFLLAAARRLAEKLAEVRAIHGAVTPADYRHALREVIAHCIHGVDRNPMALELARTALWLEGYEPGQPLSFLDSHLVWGDALLGITDFAQLRRGIPADAFKALTGDSKTVIKTLAADNRAALKIYEQRQKDTDLFSEAGTADLLAELDRLEAMPETTPAEVDAKATAYEVFLAAARESPLAQAADLLVAAFLAPKGTEADAAQCPTSRTLADLLFPRQGSTVPPEVLDASRSLCRENRVLHWPLAFIRVFSRGRFDCVLGNPPWERIKLQEEEFFASREPLIAEAKNKAERGQRIRWLAEGSLVYHLHQTPIPHGGAPAELNLYHEFVVARRLAEAVSLFAHVDGKDGGRYPLTGVGDVNTYALFAETIAQLTHRSGRAGFIVPTGIATDDSTKAFFGHLAEHANLASLFDFENREGVFPGVHRSFKFCLLTLGPAIAADFAFYLTQTEHLGDTRRRFSLSPDDFRLINPNTRTCPVFRSQADAELTKKIYRRVPVLIEEARDDEPEKNPWGISFSRLFDMATDSDLFLDQPGPDALPLYESKMVHQFDHRWATYRWDAAKGEPITDDVSDTQKSDAAFTVQPRYWVAEHHVLARIARVPRCVAQAYDAQDETALLAACATWIEAAHVDDDLIGFSLASSRQRVIAAGGPRFDALPSDQDEWLKDKALTEARSWPTLTENDLSLLRADQPLTAVLRTIFDTRSPRWLMGWRDICRATDERTVIASVAPRAAAGDTLLLMFPNVADSRRYACLLADQNSLVHDFIARQKVGGTHLKYHVKKQLTNLPPDAYTETDLAYIVPRVLELTYTSHDLDSWAADLGHDGAPFAYDPTRRAQVRAELDAYYARLYGLTRDELRYILDPADTHGADYPTETFRVLKANEIREHGEYRTRRLVLEAWDACAIQ